jgi:hypothetical protein
MGATDPQPGKFSKVRRSQRVYLSIDIEVILQRASQRPFSEETRTLIVNAHGALILLRATVELGEFLTIRNLKTQAERTCRVVDLGSSNPADAGEIGVEFLEPSPRFWRVAFPPLDWSPRNPEAKGHRPQIVTPPIATKQS